ncbi:hypothetical protein FMUND_10884 [Fusarium mundagurra]|uniref:Uncharacterized protein n=1 Tax=Fusarium mundagurra TaxID=1567541 RepID=A0A8H5YAJ3_9HYPO|nr:hypothetical protein FMUND_10884 [Fusarium mundagurra]
MLLYHLLSLLGFHYVRIGAVALMPSTREPSTAIRVSVIDGPSTLDGIPGIESQLALRAISHIKSRLGTEALLRLLQPDIQASDEFWKSIVLSSRGKAPPAFAHLDVEVDPSLFNVDMFMAWLNSSDFMAYNGANPEQYVKRRVSTEDGTSHFEITESLGGKITSFSMPDFGPGGKSSFMASLPQFPFQRTGRFQLRDGTKFADFHCAFRNKPDRSGIEATLYLWFPDATPQRLIEETTFKALEGPLDQLDRIRYKEVS